MGELLLPKDYDSFLKSLKERVRAAQLRASLSVNRELVLLYWRIGRDILERQNQAGWGAKVIDRLARGPAHGVPGHEGILSDESPLYAGVCGGVARRAICPTGCWTNSVGAQPPHSGLRERTRPKGNGTFAQPSRTAGAATSWCIRSRAAFITGRARHPPISRRTLPAAQSELAQQVVKDPYNFEFLTLAEEAHERDLERALIDHLRDFLLELGVGFAFVGSQYPLEVGGQEFRIDLLFYHLRLASLRRHRAESAEDFKPEFSGKMNFYLSAVDDLLRHPDDQPSIGIILCKSKNKVVAEYALRDLGKPVGVSEYHLAETLPKRLQESLPTIEQLEAELKEETKT